MHTLLREFTNTTVLPVALRRAAPFCAALFRTCLFDDTLISHKSGFVVDEVHTSWI